MEQKYGDKLILTDFWAQYLAKSQKCRYNLAIGAYRSSKSTFNILAFAIYLNTLDFLFQLIQTYLKILVISFPI